uniref:Uncharacterized protein n=1 Tax=Romanomermis culicivorax TaxID=13658 RepID=A0A915IFA6_ROMCU
MPNEKILRGNTLHRSPPRVASAGNLLNLGDGDQQQHAARDPVILDQTPVRVQPLKQQPMHITPRDAGVPIDNQLVIAIKQQEAGSANPNPDADGLPPGNIKRLPPWVELAGPKRDVLRPEIQPNLDEVDPKIERHRLERIRQDQEQLRQPERAPELSNQEFAMQLRELKRTVKPCST